MVVSDIVSKLLMKISQSTWVGPSESTHMDFGLRSRETICPVLKVNINGLRITKMCARRDHCISYPNVKTMALHCLHCSFPR